MDPWERRADETSVAYEAFRAYLELGSERSSERVGKMLGKSHTLMTRWCARHEWVARSRAWDSISANAAAESYAQRAARIAEQHDRVATKLLAKLEANLDALPEGADPSVKWSTAQMAAHRGHSFAADLTKPEGTAKEEIVKSIEQIITKLAGG
jgi:hypothetical protein